LARKKRPLFKIIVFPLLLLTGAGTATYFITNHLNKPRFVRYKEFGIDIPESYSIHGIDVSHHQDAIDWKEVKSMQVKNIKVGFSFIKATEGLGRVDNEFRRNWFKIKESGMPRGAYHFFIASKSGKAQAENFIETVDLSKGDLPPVLDIETTNGSSVENIKARAKDFLNVLEAHFKVKPIIYTNVDFYETFLGDDFNDYPLWIAHYLVHDKPRIERKWIFWQYNEGGHVNGIDAYVDFNVFNGDSADFKKLLIK